ncbi:MAG: hypothetical protein HXX12_14030 [Geothrix sp.]|uniref:hypothetical protein n=1 Tax=Geothrix sp. TaxID=1962974 RepID=UPI0017C8A082|nr:hypothetical protein [Geothrix sp.]NWJ42077.1 hypothetical protein [Geothrix sp.]WIL19955.1 MAG: hypothetical protein QOZ81_002494 [Geothrix sp.]
MRAILIWAIASLSAIAGPREESLRYNSRCIRAHADAYDYTPSTAQRAALDAVSQDPKRVQELLIVYVKESLADFQNGVRLGAANSKLKGLDSATKRELVTSFKKDATKCSVLLKELQSIDLMGLITPGIHSIKGKEGACPHDVDGRLNIAKFRKLK